MKIIEPNVGHWYSNLQEEVNFEVVAYEKEQGLIEIQYFDGDLEEIDIESWYELTLETIPQPEDWSGPFELERDDFGHTDTLHHPDKWISPLSDLGFKED